MEQDDDGATAPDERERAQTPLAAEPGPERASPGPAPPEAPTPPPAPDSPAWWRAALPAVALTLGIALLMLWLAGGFTAQVEPGPPGADAAPVATALATAERRSFPETIEQVGTVRSRYRADVASKLLAQVVSLRVEAGDRVSGPDEADAGTLVATLDSRDLRAQLARSSAQRRAAARAVEVQQAQVTAAEAARTAARARLERAQADFARTQALVERGVATTEQLDSARAGRDVAEADLAAALSMVQAAEQTLGQAREEQVVAERAIEEVEVLLGYAELRAPFAGIVTERLVEAGETVQPGQGVIRLEDPTQLELHSPVAESLAARLAIGQEVTVRIDALGADLRGAVREVAPSADPESRTVRVKVSLPRRSGLVSGLFGRLLIPVGEVRPLVIPAGAVDRVGQLELVRVAGPDGLLRRRFVTLGRRYGALVEVLSGLEPGEQVAVR